MNNACTGTSELISGQPSVGLCWDGGQLKFQINKGAVKSFKGKRLTPFTVRCVFELEDGWGLDWAAVAGQSSLRGKWMRPTAVVCESHGAFRDWRLCSPVFYRDRASLSLSGPYIPTLDIQTLWSFVHFYVSRKCRPFSFLVQSENCE